MAGGNTNRSARLPEATGDVNFSNNLATVLGILGLQFNSQTPVASGIPYVDPTGQWWGLQPFAKDLTGVPGTERVVGLLGVGISLAPAKDNQILFYDGDSGQYIFGYLTIDRQGLVMNDQQGNIIYGR